MTIRVETTEHCTLYLGDCLDVLPTLGKVDAVVTDPPYGVGLTARVTKHTTREATTKYDDGDEAFGLVLERVRAVVALGVPTAITPGTRRVISYPEPNDIGCVYFPNGAGRSRWGFNQFQPVLYYGKNPTGFRIPSSRSETHWFSRDVDHPCPKPIQWMEWLVMKCSANEGETILDPFMGSGTTGLACIKRGRHFIGIEKEPEFFELAVREIREAERMAKCDLFKEPKPVERRQLELV